MGRVIGNYLLTALYVLADFTLAWFAAGFAARRFPNLGRPQFRSAAFFAGSGLLLVAGIGRLGWSIQTIDGVSPSEALDQSIFFSLSLLGTFLLVFDYSVGRLTK